MNVKGFGFASVETPPTPGRTTKDISAEVLGCHLRKAGGNIRKVVGKRQFCEGELLGLGGLGGAIASLRVGLDGILIAEGGKGGRAFADLRTGEVVSKATLDAAKRHEGGGFLLERKAEGSLRKVIQCPVHHPTQIGDSLAGVLQKQIARRIMAVPCASPSSPAHLRIR